MNDPVQRAIRVCMKQLEPHARIVCALSGGADSVALTHALWSLSKTERPDLQIEAAHLNHNLRAEESRRDAAFVRAFCAQRAIVLHEESVQIPALGTGTEDAARQARYAFLRRITGMDYLATAHTMEDNAETMLLQLTRGTGLRGLGGIAPRTGQLLRPLLGVREADIRAYCCAQGLRFVEDSTNLSDAYRRNRIRHHVLPLLREENPNVDANMLETARQLRQEEEFLSQLTTQMLAQVREGDRLLLPKLMQLHPAMRARVLRAACPIALDARKTAQLDSLLTAASPSARLDLGDGWTARRAYQTLCFQQETAAPLEPQRLPIPGSAQIGTWRIECRICGAEEQISQTSHTFYLASDRIEGDVWLRARRTGDIIQMPGGTRSLKRLMIDRKIPAQERDFYPVLADSLGVIALAGIAVDRKRLAVPGEPALRIQIKNCP